MGALLQDLCINAGIAICAYIGGIAEFVQSGTDQISRASGHAVRRFLVRAGVTSSVRKRSISLA